MGGHCIESEDFVIVVDKWDVSFLRRPGCKPHYFFLTHLHADHIQGLTSTWSRLVYTSPFNAWLLPMRRNVKQMLIKELELNVTHTIRKSNDGVAFQVTLIDANHCPGAVMFLFQGTFGNILYTGDFRYSPRILDNPVLSPIIRNKELSVLYLDNTYAAATCEFPSREEALKEVLKIVDGHPDCKILIGMRQLGKEEVLRAVALHVKEKVCVSPQRLQILAKLEYEDVFTTDMSESRIHAVELHTITQRHSQEASKVVSIKLTSMYECGNVDRQRGNIYVVPYSDHSCHKELIEFVGHLRPLQLFPIIQPMVPKMTADTGVWYRMSTVNCVLPNEIWQLCGPATEEVTSSSSEDQEKTSDVSPLRIKFHPAPKPVDVEKRTMYIDEGLNILPFDSLGSQLTNNNKARKQIKASWTRLAPKILTQKGIQFCSESPVKNLQEGETFNEQGVGKTTENREGLEDRESCISELKENRGTNNDGSLLEVNLSDGDDDFDMPSSARELGMRLQLPANGPIVNGGAEDRKSECSSELTVGSLKTDLLEDVSISSRSTRSKLKGKSTAKPEAECGLNDLKDSNSDNSSTKRTTRSRSSISPSLLLGKPRTRLSLESSLESLSNSRELRKTSRANLRDNSATSSKRVSKLTPSKSSAAKKMNGLDRRCTSLESLSTISIPKASPSKAVEKNGRRGRASIVEDERHHKKSPMKPSESKKTSKEKINEEEGEKVGLRSASDVVESTATKSSLSDRGAHVTKCERVDGSEQSSGMKACSKEPAEKSCRKEVVLEAAEQSCIKESSREPLGKSCSTESRREPAEKSSTKISISEPVESKKTLVNGLMLVGGLNGIHINSPGRKRVPLSCDWNAAQEIVRKETEQALKALESLNQMKGFKTRSVGNRSGFVALRRLSADNIASLPPAKSQSFVFAPPAPAGLRPRTASILSSMADTFRKASVPSSPKQTSISPPGSAEKEIKRSEVKKTKPLKKVLDEDNSEASIKEKLNSNVCERVKDDAMNSVVEREQDQRDVKKSCNHLNQSDSNVNISSAKAEQSLQRQKQHHISPIQVASEGSKTLSDVEVCIDTKVTQSECKEQSMKTSLEPNDDSGKSLDVKEQSMKTSSEPNDDSGKSLDVLNQGLFLTDETLASSSSSGKTKSAQKTTKRSLPKKQNDLNVDLIRLKVGFAMTQKSAKRLSLPTRLTSVRRDMPHKSGHDSAPFQSKEKVQDWRQKISLRLRKSPQRRYKYKSPSKLRDSAKRTLASILRSGRSLNKSEGYQADVEDCTQLTQESHAADSQKEDNSGYLADEESCTPASQGNECFESSSVENSLRKSSSPPGVLRGKESLNFDDSKVGILNEVRRSSRISKEDGVNLPLWDKRENRSKKVSSKPYSHKDQNSDRIGENTNTTDKIARLSPQKLEEISPIPKCPANPRRTDEDISPASRFSNRLSEKTKMILNKGSGNVLSQKSSNILSLMADAFQKAVSPPNPMTANILSSMAENFQKLDEGAQISPSLSIQLVPAKPRRFSPKDNDSTNWGVQITRVQTTSSKQSPSTVKANTSSSSLTSIPKSLSIEIIPEDDDRDPKRSKGPSPPTVSICPEVIDLTSETSGKFSSQSTIQSLPVPPGPKSLPQGGVRWPVRKSERNVIQPPPPAVWKEKRSSTQPSDRVIIDIQTQEDSQQVGHCPVHCTCGASMRHGTCMGTMRNLIEEDADCLYEVPLSPEDLENSGAMIALGRGWIESCFEDEEDREEFFQSYEDVLPTLGASIKQSKRKSVPSKVSSQSRPTQRPSVQCQNRRFSIQAVQQASHSSKQNVLPSSTKKNLPVNTYQNHPITQQSTKESREPTKRSSTDSERSVTLLREIEKKIRAYTDEQSRKTSPGRKAPSRRSSLQSSSSSISLPKSKSSKKSLSPPPEKNRQLDTQKIVKKPSGDSRKRKCNTSSSASESPETKKPRNLELERLTGAGTTGVNKRYRYSVRRSLHHLLTNQKLRSKRV